LVRPAVRTMEDHLHKELRLLEALAESPEARQVDLARRLGVAVGTVNWLIKRLAARGLIKVKRIGRWRWRYLLTPRGMREKARLSVAYVRNSMALYRQVRQRARELLEEVKARGFDEVRLEGEEGNDLVDVCRLTCLEQGVKVIPDGHRAVPALRVRGLELSLELPGKPLDLSEEVLSEIVNRIVRAVHPERVFILGPDTAGKEDGHLTAVVVGNSPFGELEGYGEIRREVENLGVPIDVMFFSPDEFRKWEMGLKRQKLLAQWPEDSG